MRESLVLCLGQRTPDCSIGCCSISPQNDHCRQFIIGSGTLTQSLEPGPAGLGFVAQNTVAASSSSARPLTRSWPCEFIATSIRSKVRSVPGSAAGASGRRTALVAPSSRVPK